MPELSIIVPIYNVEAYLPRCLDSILAQTFTDFELILVDDGSPDRCGEIMEEYAAQDGRIITVHQENLGVSAARNAGLRLAQGTYIGFVDPDDWIDPEMYVVLLAMMKETGSDLGICDWRDSYPNGGKQDHLASVKTLLDQEELIKELFAVPRSVGGSVCNKLFKRALIRDLFDETLTICEDNVFLCSYCTGIRQACYTDRVRYNIFFRESSAIRKAPARIALGLAGRRKMIDLVSPLGRSVRDCAEADYLDSCLLLVQNTDNEADKEYNLIARNEFTSYMRRHCPQVLLNHKIPWKTKCLYVLRTLSLL